MFIWTILCRLRLFPLLFPFWITTFWTKNRGIFIALRLQNIWLWCLNLRRFCVATLFYFKISCDRFCYNSRDRKCISHWSTTSNRMFWQWSFLLINIPKTQQVRAFVLVRHLTSFTFVSTVGAFLCNCL